MKVEVGEIPKAALAVLAAGFARHNDHWVETIARSFLEAWPNAETARDAVEEKRHIILPLEPRV